MNLLKLSLISLLVTFSYGYELKISKTFDESLEPDRMQLSFSLIAKKESAAKTKEVLHKAIESIKKEPLCKGGGYSITPEYDYNSKERELLDYIGTADFECSFKNIEEIDTLLAFFDKLEDLELRQAPIRWIVDKENIKIEKTSLEFRAIKYAKDYAEILSIEEIAKCSVKNVEIIADGYVRYEAQSMLMAKSTMQTPTKEPTILNLNATYTYDCE